MSQVKIYHNPGCGTSRNTLALIRNAGIEPEIIYYLEHPPSVGELTQMINDAGLSVRQTIRVNVPPYTELGLEKDIFKDQELLNFMVEHPLLINRPFVVSPIGTRLARPSEVVLDILTEPQQGAFSKEDGEQIIDDRGQRLK
ncbi:MAG: arsenate reductase (glutaredoxin) [Acinetobacter sp.]|nr:arsenate reductase (glutaredoxin) [Acinetobacter sp.]